MYMNMYIYLLLLRIYGTLYHTTKIAKVNPDMTLPSLQMHDGQVVNGSRSILSVLYGKSETVAETELLDLFYSVDVSNMAWLIGSETIHLLGLMVKTETILNRSCEKLKELEKVDPINCAVYQVSHKYVLMYECSTSSY
jgi:hypothetical protein